MRIRSKQSTTHSNRRAFGLEQVLAVLVQRVLVCTRGIVECTVCNLHACYVGSHGAASVRCGRMSGQYVEGRDKLYR